MAAHSGGEISELRPAGLIHHPDVIVSSNYSKVGEHLRQVTPPELQCSVFCGGRRCKYDSFECWDGEEMAIDGIYSHWVTNNILAMARPNTDVIGKKDIVSQFLEKNIKTIINLQLPGEHSSCGGPICESGFSYDPNVFMKQRIFYYNFALRDHTEPTLNGILDMVKVMAFSLSEGKVAVHCHAGLGRTGVLIACYLVYALRVRANDAIRYVRMKRPNAVQTSGQILVVKEFEAFILPQLYVFCNRDFTKDKKNTEFTLHQYLHRQRTVLHGYEARALKHIPKIVYVICERLLKLCGCGGLSSAPTIIAPLEICYSIGTRPFTTFFLAAKYDRESARIPYSVPLSIDSPLIYSSLSGSRTALDLHSVESFPPSVVLNFKIENQTWKSSSSDSQNQINSQPLDLLKQIESRTYEQVATRSASRNYLDPFFLDEGPSHLFSWEQKTPEGFMLNETCQSPTHSHQLPAHSTDAADVIYQRESMRHRLEEDSGSTETDEFSVDGMSAPSSAQYPTRRYNQDCITPDVPSCTSVMQEHSIDHLLNDGINNQHMDENSCFQELTSQDDLRKHAKDETLMMSPNEVVEALLLDHSLLNAEFRKLVKIYRIDLNVKQSAWEKLTTETNLYLLTGLLFAWLEHLKQPLLSVDSLSYVVLTAHKPEVCLRKLDTETRYTVEYIVRFVSRLHTMNREQTEMVMRRLIASLTQQAVPVRECLLPAGKGYHKLREGTLRKCIEFMMKLYDTIHFESRANSVNSANSTPSTITCVTPPGQVSYPNLGENDQLNMED